MYEAWPPSPLSRLQAALSLRSWLQVFLWDSRLASKQPRAVLTPAAATGAMNCLAVSPGGELIMAGTKSGEVSPGPRTLAPIRDGG